MIEHIIDELQKQADKRCWLALVYREWADRMASGYFWDRNGRAPTQEEWEKRWYRGHFA